MISSHRCFPEPKERKGEDSCRAPSIGNELPGELANIRCASGRRVAPGGQITQQALPAINGEGMGKRIPGSRSECSIANCRAERIFNSDEYYNTQRPSWAHAGQILGFRPNQENAAGLYHSLQVMIEI